MTKDQSYGGLILVVSIIVAVIYLFGVATPGLYQYAIGIPVVLAVLAILGITAWIGWTMFTTPPPAPLETELTASAPAVPTSTSTTSQMGRSKTDE